MTSTFKYESNNKTLEWHNFKYYGENNLTGDSGKHQCKYRDYRNNRMTLR